MPATVKKPVVYDETTGKLRLIAAGETLDSNADVLQQTASGAISAGQCVSAVAGGNTVSVTDATSASLSCARVGVACEAIGDTATGGIVHDGPVVLPTGTWDARTGDTGGLTPGAVYWVDPAAPGDLTMTPPAVTASPKYVIVVGVGLADDTLMVKLGDPFRI